MRGVGITTALFVVFTARMVGQCLGTGPMPGAGGICANSWGWPMQHITSLLIGRITVILLVAPALALLSYGLIMSALTAALALVGG